MKSIPGCEVDGRSDYSVDGGHVQQEHDEGHRGAGNSGGGRSGMSGSNSHVFQEEARDGGEHSEQLYCDDDVGVGGAGKITEDRVNPNQGVGGRSVPRLEKPYIPLEPKVRLTSNQAVNLSLWFVLRPI